MDLFRQAPTLVKFIGKKVKFRPTNIRATGRPMWALNFALLSHKDVS